MAPSNSVFFTLQTGSSFEGYPLQTAAWEVQVVWYKDYETKLAVIPEFVELSVGPELNAPGQGSVTLDADSPFWDQPLPGGSPAWTLLDNENLWQAYQDGILRFEWLGTTVEEHIVEEDASKHIVVSGPGAAQMLSWACVMPNNFPPATEAPIDINDLNTLKYFPTYPLDSAAMAIWYDQLWAAKVRGTCGIVQPTFNKSFDSSGQAWEKVQTGASTNPDTGISIDLTAQQIKLEVGTNLLDLLAVHTGQDYSKQFAERVEWIMWPGFQLDVRKTIGTRKEGQVVFFESNSTVVQRSRVRNEVANYVLTFDVNGSTAFTTDAASIETYGQREAVNLQNRQVTDPPRRAALNQVYLNQHKDEKDQWTITVPYDDPGRRPFVDYNVGDWIGVSLHSKTSSSITEAFRVLTMVVNIDNNGVATTELTLQSTIDAWQKLWQGQVTSIVNTIGNGVVAPPWAVAATVPRGAGMVTWHPTDGYIVTPRPIRVFIQGADPGADAKTGDLWTTP